MPCVFPDSVSQQYPGTFEGDMLVIAVTPPYRLLVRPEASEELTITVEERGCLATRDRLIRYSAVK